MRVTYNERVDSAYIFLAEDIAPGVIAKTYLCGPEELGTLVTIDLDHEGHILGIEVLGAKKALPASCLDQAWAA